MAIDRSDLHVLGARQLASLHGHWKTFLVEGAVLVVLGIVAVVLPVFATVAVAIVVGWVLLMSGLLGLYSSMRMQQAPGFHWSLISAIVALVAGVFVLVSPLGGALSLTLILTLFLTLEGIASIMLSLQHRQGFAARWSYLMISGVIDLLLAGFIVAGLPGTAAWAIGILLGVNLFFGGSALIAMAWHARGTPPLHT